MMHAAHTSSSELSRALTLDQSGNFRMHKGMLMQDGIPVNSSASAPPAISPATLAALRASSAERAGSPPASPFCSTALEVVHSLGPEDLNDDLCRQVPSITAPPGLGYGCIMGNLVPLLRADGHRERSPAGPPLHAPNVLPTAAAAQQEHLASTSTGTSNNSSNNTKGAVRMSPYNGGALAQQPGPLAGGSECRAPPGPTLAGPGVGGVDCSPGKVGELQTSLTALALANHSIATAGSMPLSSFDSCMYTGGGPPCGVKAVCGKRAKMEDAHCVRHNFFDLPISPASLSADDAVANKLPPRIALQLDSADLALLSSSNSVPLSPSPAGVVGGISSGTATPPTASGAAHVAASSCGSDVSNDTLHFFGVYDGHGGTEAAQHCAARLHHHLGEALSSVCGILLADAQQLQALGTNAERACQAEWTLRNSFEGEAEAEAAAVAAAAAAALAAPASVIALVGNDDHAGVVSAPAANISAVAATPPVVGTAAVEVPSAASPISPTAARAASLAGLVPAASAPPPNYGAAAVAPGRASGSGAAVSVAMAIAPPLPHPHHHSKDQHQAHGKEPGHHHTSLLSRAKQLLLGGKDRAEKAAAASATTSAASSPAPPLPSAPLALAPAISALPPLPHSSSQAQSAPLPKAAASLPPAAPLQSAVPAPSSSMTTAAPVAADARSSPTAAPSSVLQFTAVPVVLPTSAAGAAAAAPSESTSGMTSALATPVSGTDTSSDSGSEKADGDSQESGSNSSGSSASSRSENLTLTAMLEEALRDAFLRTDAEFAADGSASMVGSTAVVALVGSKRMWVANCGDSRAVLCRGHKAIQLTDDHKPEREDEARRVEEAGGQVLFWNGHRVMGVLAMSRAIGDHGLRPYIIPEPEITIVSRAEDDDFLLLASDGLWDVMSNQEATHLAVRCLERAKEKGASRKSAVRIAASVLTKAAIDRGSKDNVTVVVVDLKAPTPGAPVEA